MDEDKWMIFGVFPENFNEIPSISLDNPIT